MAHELQWQFRVNQKIYATPNYAVWPWYTADNMSRAVMWHIKDCLVGGGAWTDAEGAATTPSNTWIVRGSSNSVAFGNNDGVDRWTTPTNVVPGSGANPKSWIVLAQPKISENFEMCISMDGSQSYQCSVIVSPNKRFGAVGGGVDGTATARPTALDQIVVRSANDYGAGSWVGGKDVVHVLHAADGSATRILIMRNNSAAGYWAFEKPADPPSGWNHPSISYVYGTSTTNLTGHYIDHNATYQAALFKGRSRDYPNGAEFAAFLTSITGFQRIYTEEWVANESDGSVTRTPAIYASYGQVKGRGVYGRGADLYYINAGFQSGTTNAERVWRAFGTFVLPWNKSVLLV